MEKADTHSPQSLLMKHYFWRRKKAQNYDDGGDAVGEGDDDGDEVIRSGRSGWSEGRSG